MSPVPATVAPRRSRELLSEGVRRRIEGAILDGTLIAGERLHDDDLIGWLGVSRTPIRTALERLTDLGLVEMQPNRFTRVAVATRSNLAQALQVYSALIVSAARGRVANLTESEILEFRRRVVRVDALGRRGAGGPWQRDDLEAADRVLSFFLRRAGNPLLLGLLHEVRMRIAFGFLNLAVPIDARVVRGFCVAILRAVDRRDEAAIARVLTDHLGARVLGLG